MQASPLFLWEEEEEEGKVKGLEVLRRRNGGPRQEVDVEKRSVPWHYIEKTWLASPMQPWFEETNIYESFDVFFFFFFGGGG